MDSGLLKHACPEGIYLSLTPGNFALWSGVLFVQKGLAFVVYSIACQLSFLLGPYAPAVLRFQVAFPTRYPDVAPLVLFTSDIFHPLVTPLTTYTYTTGSAATDTVSATDEDRLPPGGFSLRHGFPTWFAKGDKLNSSAAFFPGPNDPSKEASSLFSETHDSEKDERRATPNPKSFHITPPNDDDPSSDELSPSIFEVLGYLKHVFEDSMLLDNLPLEAAGNPGAWHAWQAHRRRSRPSKPNVMEGRSSSNTLNTVNNAEMPSRSSGWNWDGVWAERVKKGKNASLSESMLFGKMDGDDLVWYFQPESDKTHAVQVNFLDVDEETIDVIKKDHLKI